MELTEKIQKDIDGIAAWGYCNYSETFSTLIEAKKEIIRLRELVKEYDSNRKMNLEKPDKV